MSAPNLIYVGLPKSGSTWLYNFFSSHSEVAVGKIKDCYYFDKFYGKGDSWYFSNFPSGNEKYTVDISHDYIFSDGCAERIRKSLGEDITICCILRNPYDYIQSQYFFLKRCGYSTGSFLHAIEKFPYLLETTDYARYLKPFIDEFGKDRVIVWFFDELRSNPLGFSKKICQDLNLSCDQYDLDLVESKSMPASKPVFGPLIYTLRSISSLFRSLGLTSFVSHVKDSSLVNKLLFREYKVRPEISKSELRAVSHEVLANIDSVELLLGREVPGWKID